jgi:hypothetical protein
LCAFPATKRRSFGMEKEDIIIRIVMAMSPKSPPLKRACPATQEV